MFPVARFAMPTVCGLFGPPPSEPGEGRLMCRVTCPSRPGSCARASPAILVVLLERSRPIFRGARF